MKAETDWIAADWGTTHLRLWLMRDDGTVLEHRDSDQGMGKLSPGQFEPVLNEILSDIAQKALLPVIVCGMAGARQGWKEAPYVGVPCNPPGIDQAVTFANRHWHVSILPGVMQDKPADVMRGEETQISGFLHENPAFDGVLCLPGTHTKWVQVRANEIVGFRTFMTGELFALLSTQSILRHSVQTDEWDQPAFEAVLSGADIDPGNLAAGLFSLRAGSILHDVPKSQARATLSALLIGAEISTAQSSWHGRQVVILGDRVLAEAYQSALACRGIDAQCVNARKLTLEGLKAAYYHQREARS